MARFALVSTLASPTCAMRTCLSSAVVAAAAIAARAASTAAVIVGSSIVGPPGAGDVSDTGFAFVLECSGVRAGARAPRSILGGNPARVRRPFPDPGTDPPRLWALPRPGRPPGDGEDIPAQVTDRLAGNPSRRRPACPGP